jgi:hypothetical protein
MVLIYGLAATLLAISISVDAAGKLLLLKVVEEKTTIGTVPHSYLLFKKVENGKIIYKDVGYRITKSYILPPSNIELYHYLNLIPISSSFIFLWAGTVLLLRHYYYQRTGKVTLTFWIIVSLPLIFYLVGKIPDMLSSLPPDTPYLFYFKILFRAGSIGGSILFGLAFFIIARNLASAKVKSYLTTSAIGITMMGISFSSSAFQQTYGVAAHSLVLLSSYLFITGLYSSAVSISQDRSLRLSVRKSMMELLDKIGTAQMEEDLQKRVEKLAKSSQENMEQQTGISSSLTEDDVSQYMTQVLNEIHKKKQINK